MRRSNFHEKLINDSFRTWKTSKEFTDRVPHSLITRALNAAINHLQENHELFDTYCRFTYVQGMNVTLAPFLYTMNELSAINCYVYFIRHVCPTYVQPKLEGVYAGVKIFDTIFKKLDPHLYTYLREKGLISQVFAFSCKSF